MHGEAAGHHRCQPSVVNGLRVRRLVQQQALPRPDRGRRLYPGVPGHRGGTGAQGGSCGGGDGTADVPTGAATGEDPGRQWPGSSPVLDHWAYVNGVVLDSSRHGKPTENAYVESFNGWLRDECLNTHWFLSLDDARAKIEAWRRHYNEGRPHTSLGYKTPADEAPRSSPSGGITFRSRVRGRRDSTSDRDHCQTRSQGKQKAAEIAMISAAFIGCGSTQSPLSNFSIKTVWGLARSHAPCPRDLIQPWKSLCLLQQERPSRPSFPILARHPEDQRRQADG